MRERSFSGTRSSPRYTARAKLPKVCITPLGVPVVPDVYMIVDRSFAARVGLPCSGAVRATMSSHRG